MASRRDGYTYELNDKSYDNDIGGNWAESCNVRGTPGSAPIKNCTFTCQDTQCQQGGSTGACCGSGSTCNSTINNCICQDITYYSIDTACLKVPEPSNCEAALYNTYIIDNGTENIPNLQFNWDAAAMTDPHQYELTFYDPDGQEDTSQTASRTLTLTDFDEDRDISLVWGTLRTYVTFNGNDAYSESVNCYVTTLAPIPAPTPAPTDIPTPAPTDAPTPSPVFDSPYCYVGGDICEEDRCECNNKDEACVGNTNSRSFAASDDPQFITIKCWPRDFGFKIRVNWTMDFIGYTDDDGTLIDTNDTRRLQDDEDYGVSPMEGNVTFPVDEENNEQRISLLLSVSTKVSSSVRYRKFLVKVNSCELPTTTAYNCKSVYPNEFYMIVDVTGGKAYSSSKREKEMPEWVWYVLACLAIFMVILAWLVYRYWFKSNEAKRVLGETEEELDQAIQDNEMGLDHDLGMGDIALNPMATGVPNTERAPDLIQNEINQRKMEADRTKVDAPTEKFSERQQIGQHQGRKNKKGNDLQQPLLG